MRKPYEGEGVICPDSVSKRPYLPGEVYEVKEANGKISAKGILRPHKKHHIGASEDCDWVGHPAPIVPIPRPKKAE